MTKSPKFTYSTEGLAEQAGISYRQADTWTRAGHLQPLGGQTPGSGTSRSFPEAEVQIAALIGELTAVEFGLRTAALLARQQIAPHTHDVQDYLAAQHARAEVLRLLPAPLWAVVDPGDPKREIIALSASEGRAEIFAETGDTGEDLPWASRLAVDEHTGTATCPTCSQVRESPGPFEALPLIYCLGDLPAGSYGPDAIAADSEGGAL